MKFQLKFGLNWGERAVWWASDKSWFIPQFCHLLTFITSNSELDQHFNKLPSNSQLTNCNVRFVHFSFRVVKIKICIQNYVSGTCIALSKKWLMLQKQGDKRYPAMQTNIANLIYLAIPLSGNLWQTWQDPDISDIIYDDVSDTS